MRFEIKKGHPELDIPTDQKVLFVDDQYVASWPDRTCDEVIIGYALDEAFQRGQREKIVEIRHVLGLAP